MRIDQITTSVELPVRLPNGEIERDEFGNKLTPFDWTNGTVSDMVLKVTSMETAAVRAASFRAHKETLGSKEEEMDPEKLEKANAKIYAACIVGWSGVENADGEVPYSPEKAVELMLKPELKFMHEQVQWFVHQRAKFFPGRSESSGTDGSKPGKE